MAPTELFLDARRGEPSLRFQNKKVQPRDRAGTRARCCRGARDGTARMGPHADRDACHPRPAGRAERGHYHRDRLQERPGCPNGTSSGGLRRSPSRAPRSQRPSHARLQRGPATSTVTNAAGASVERADDFTSRPPRLRRSHRSRPRAVRRGHDRRHHRHELRATTSVVSFNTMAATCSRRRIGDPIIATVPAGATTGRSTSRPCGAPGEQRHQLHRGCGTHDHVVHADERPGGYERHDHRYEPHRRDRRQVQRSHSDVHTSTATSVTATVPSGATTGKITVTTPAQRRPAPPTSRSRVVTKHERSVNLHSRSIWSRAAP